MLHKLPREVWIVQGLEHRRLKPVQGERQIHGERHVHVS